MQSLVLLYALYRSEPLATWLSGEKRILHFSKCHPSTKWLGRVHHVVLLKTKGFAFQDWKYADKRHKWKEKVQKNAQFPFCGQTKAFCYDIVLRGIQPCFLRIGALGLFWTNKAARFLKTLRYIPYSMIKKSTFLKGNFLYFKGFMVVFYILTSVWKKNHKMCIWNCFFAMCSTDLTRVNATI